MQLYQAEQAAPKSRHLAEGMVNICEEGVATGPESSGLSVRYRIYEQQERDIAIVGAWDNPIESTPIIRAHAPAIAVNLVGLIEEIREEELDPITIYSAPERLAYFEALRSESEIMRRVRFDWEETDSPWCHVAKRIEEDAAGVAPSLLAV